MRALLGIPSLVLGIAVVAIADGDVVRLVGLGVWWVGVLLVVDLWLGDGLPAQILWGLGTGVAVWVFSSGRAQSVVLDHWAVVASGVGVVLVVLLLRLMASGRRREVVPATVTRAVRAPVPVLLEVMGRYAVQADAREVVESYRRTHGSDTESTSDAPGELRRAVVRLGRELESIRQRHPVDGDAYVSAVVLARYAGLLAELTLDRERG